MTITQLSGCTTFTGLSRETSPASSANQINRASDVFLRKGAWRWVACRSSTFPYPPAVHTMQHSFRLPIVHRKHVFSKVNNQLNSDCSLQPHDVEEQNAIINSSKICDDLNGKGGSEVTRLKDKSLGIPDCSLEDKDIQRELLLLTLPAMAGQAIDPLTQLMETAYIGRLGSVELASAGVSMTIFSNISKLFNMPLLSVATSFVAEDISKNAGHFPISEEDGRKNNPLNSQVERKQLSSVSTALLLAVGIGIFEGLALTFGSELLLSLMGVSSASPMHGPAKKFLVLRAIGAPAFVVSQALQGVFRGFKDTKTPVFCLGFGNFTAIFLFPLLMYYFGMGVSGAAISTVLSQYIVAFSLIWHLNKRVALLPPKLGDLKFGTYLKSGGFLIGRTLSVLVTMTVAASMAARQGPVAMAAHQICFQLWLAASLLTDAPAASAQAMIASYLSEGDYTTVREVTHFVLKIGLVTGLLLAAVLGISFGPLASLFTKETEVLGVVKTGLLFVTITQPLNSLAFIFDGLHYGVSDFPYAARSMMLVGVISSGFLLYAPRIFGLPGVWLGLTLFMGLRMMAGFFRIRSKGSPWWFLHDDAYGRKKAACYP